MVDNYAEIVDERGRNLMYKRTLPSRLVLCGYDNPYFYRSKIRMKIVLPVRKRHWYRGIFLAEIQLISGLTGSGKRRELLGGGGGGLFHFVSYPLYYKSAENLALLASNTSEIRKSFKKVECKLVVDRSLVQLQRSHPVQRFTISDNNDV